MRHIGLLTLFLLSGLPASADEGMWTFDNVPSEQIRHRYGTDITPEWLDHLRRSTVRLEGGCSASLASPDGLVLTNHHCVVDCVSRLSTPGRDAQALGFLARSRGREERCEAEQASVLTALEDITRQVAEAAGDGTDPRSNQQRKAALTRLEQACEEKYQAAGDPHSCEAVTLYGGGQYFLYHYRRYEDVRLVFAPETDVAFFGGDIDNFQFPRWNMDFALLRLYAGGEPATTPDYLRWRRGGAAPGEAVFVAGHPGSTDRLKTVPQLLFDRNVVLNTWLPRAAELRGRYLELANRDAEAARIVQEPLFGLENAFKVRRNQMNVLLDDGFLRAREKQEAALRKAVGSNPGLRKYAGSWDEIGRSLASFNGFYQRYTFIEQGAALQGDLATYARLLVRAAGERQKPNELRQREYTEAALPLLQQQLLAPAPVYPDLETLRLTYSLEKMQESLGIDDPAVRLAIGRQSPGKLAARLVRETRLGDPAYRGRLWDGGQAALEKSTDPLIRLAMGLEPDALQLRQRYEDEVEAPLLSAGERLARARFAVQGRSTYPDATFTLRLSYGAVQGWREGDREIEPFTTVEGLFARATGQLPFRLPATWLRARERINLDTRLNFSSSNDITGGNSGSPVVDSEGRLVGLVFDGNIHSIGGDYWFDAGLNRAVAVHPAAMVMALADVYDARFLLQEMAIE